MALRDVKNYYYTMLKQYVETKADLVDFEEALKDGYITEDKLESVKEDVNRIKENLDRIQYIMYLFEIPKRKSKQEKYHEANTSLENYFSTQKADEESLKAENESVLTHLRAEIKKLEQDLEK